MSDEIQRAMDALPRTYLGRVIQQTAEGSFRYYDRRDPPGSADYEPKDAASLADAMRMIREDFADEKSRHDEHWFFDADGKG